jgi:hypothetical protein
MTICNTKQYKRIQLSFKYGENNLVIANTGYNERTFVIQAVRYNLVWLCLNIPKLCVISPYVF